MKFILSEKKIVAILFVMVFITFALAQEDSRKMEKMQSGITTIMSPALLVQLDEMNKAGETPVLVSEKE